MTSRSSWQKPAIPFPRLILILSLCSAFAPFATDMYLPAFGQLVNHFHTDAAHIETTVSFFFLGLAVGQILYGPLIDRFGRRKPMLAGIAVFLLATLGCLLVQDINTFIGLRLLQAIGGCCGMIIGRAIVSDLFAEHEMARVMSSLMIVMSLAPICAPLIGGWLVTHFSWISVFIALLVLGSLCGLAVLFGLPETKPPHKENTGNLLQGYLTLLKRPAYLVPALSGSLTQSCMFFLDGSGSECRIWSRAMCRDTNLTHVAVYYSALADHRDTEFSGSYRDRTGDVKGGRLHRQCLGSDWFTAVWLWLYRQQHHCSFAKWHALPDDHDHGRLWSARHTDVVYLLIAAKCRISQSRINCCTGSCSCSRCQTRYSRA